MITSSIIILDSNKLMVCKLTKEGIIYNVNDYFIEISGYEKSEVIGKTIEELKPFHTPTAIYSALMDTLDKKQDANIIVKDSTKDGHAYWFITEFIFNKDKDGNYTTCFCVRKKSSYEAHSNA